MGWKAIKEFLKPGILKVLLLFVLILSLLMLLPMGERYLISTLLNALILLSIIFIDSVIHEMFITIALITIVLICILYTISCTIVVVYRKLKTINEKFSLTYIISIFLILLCLPAWNLYSYFVSVNIKISFYDCKIAVERYCNLWSNCNFSDECKPNFIPSAHFDEVTFKGVCVQKFGFEDIRDITPAKCKSLTEIVRRYPR